jgi:hypothetical protein
LGVEPHLWRKTVEDGSARAPGGAGSVSKILFVFSHAPGRKTDAIQKRAAYFGCIAALDGSSEALAPAERPFSSWPASSVPPRSSRARTGAAERRRSSASWRTGAGRARHQSRPSSGGGDRDLRAGVRLASEVKGQWDGLVGVGPASPRHTYRKLGTVWRGREKVGTHDGPQEFRTSSRSSRGCRWRGRPLKNRPGQLSSGTSTCPAVDVQVASFGRHARVVGARTARSGRSGRL